MIKNKYQIADQAEGLRLFIKQKSRSDKVKAIQTELRHAIIAGEYKKVDTLMVLLEQAQIEFETIEKIRNK